ncbi:MAG: hypothetical protein LBS19_00655 [Clostridiales bacterium]|nr:hypothetical protein [Clostridiales bacterium]
MVNMQYNLLDIKEVKAFLENIPEDRKILADGLVSKLEYLTNLLNKLEKQLDEGLDVAFVRAYNETIQRYGIICKQLAGLLPRATENLTNDPLIQFIGKGGKK